MDREAEKCSGNWFMRLWRSGGPTIRHLEAVMAPRKAAHMTQPCSKAREPRSCQCNSWRPESKELGALTSEVVKQMSQHQNRNKVRMWGYTPVIPSPQEAETEGSHISGQAVQVSKILSQNSKKGQGCSSVA